MILIRIMNLLLGYDELHVCRDKQLHFANLKKLEKANIKYKTHTRGSSRSVYEEKIYSQDESLTYTIDVKREDFDEARRLLERKYEAL